MSVNPLVSIVFPTFERPLDLSETLRRLRESLSMPYEVIVVDNSPTPSAPDHAFLTNEKYFFLGRNIGAASRNIGINKASAPFVLMLDDDSHPLPGALEKAVTYLENRPAKTAGLGARIERADGSREGPPLLPTVFHGCGALFRKSALSSCGDVYPDNFGFYSEEYWVSFLLFSKGFTLDYFDDFRVCHRLSASGRSKKRILFQLSKNNDCVWKAFTPLRYLDDVLYDTNRRYELITRKEGVPESFTEGKQLSIQPPFREPMTDEAFEAASLIAAFSRSTPALREKSLIVLCGVGKFPSLWARHLVKLGADKVILTDFNSGICGNDFAGFMAITANEALKLHGKDTLYVVGHSSRADSDAWRSLLASNGIEYHNLDIHHIK